MNYKHKTLKWVAKKDGKYIDFYRIGTIPNLIPKELIENSSDWLPIEERKPLTIEERLTKIEEFLKVTYEL